MPGRLESSRFCFLIAAFARGYCRCRQAFMPYGVHRFDAFRPIVERLRQRFS
jgi:hypothetical protein